MGQKGSLFSVLSGKKYAVMKDLNQRQCWRWWPIWAMEVSEDWISHKMESLHVYDDFSFHDLFVVYLYVSNISTSLSIRHCHPGRSKMVTNIGQKSFYTLWQFSKTFCSHWRNCKHKYRLCTKTFWAYLVQSHQYTNKGWVYSLQRSAHLRTPVTPVAQ